MQDQFCSLHLTWIKSKKFCAGVWSSQRCVSRLIAFYNLALLWTAMVRMIWSPDRQSGRGRSVLMLLHSVRPIVSRVYAPDVITETRTAHGNSDARMTAMPDFVRTMQFRCNKRSRLRVRASRDVLNAISISLRGSAVSSRCHATATCIKYYLFLTLIS